ncbi:carbohydrate ABC transporter permease [Saccharopolyspora sp. NPDC050389]|uniref:carbohydrate ABC transporter permease n=1 Tax=Saccharopolyspora sp. NPDC050389 TaxID=3155516 RepID=UPI0033EA6E19
MRTRRIGLSALALAIAVIFVFPTYWMFASSFKPRGEVLSTSYDLVPSSVTLQNYATALFGSDFLRYLGNSLLVTLTAVACSLVAGTLAALAMSRFRFRGRKGFLMLVLVAQMVPFEALMVPMFLFMRDLGLLNKLPSLILVYWITTLPFTIWSLRGFIDGIPVDLEEAAMVDGCGRAEAFRRVTLPLLGPGLVATSVFAFITAWNEFLYALIFMRSQDLQTLPVFLQTFQNAFGTDWGATMAAATLFTLPVLVFFLAVQRKMVSGVTAGAVKG